MRKILLYVACVFSVCLFIYYFSARADTVTHGYASCYTFSRILLEEGDLSRAYDSAYFDSKVREFGISNIREKPNIPTSAFLFIPIALFRPETGKIIWSILNIVFYLMSIYLLLRVFDLAFTAINSLFLIFTAILFYPVFNVIDLGQIYVILLLLFCVSLCGIKKNSVILTALPISLMILFRGYGLVPLLFLIFLKKRKEFFVTLAITGGLFVITLPLLSVETWKQYIINVPLRMGHDEFASNTAYQTLNSLIRHIFSAQSEAFYVSAILILFSFALLTFARNIVQNEYGRLLLYCSALSLNVIFAPVAEEFHYTLFLPLIFGVAVMILENYESSIVEAVIFLVSLFLFYVPVDYKALNNASFPLILFAYPRLYGGVLLIIIAYSKRTPTEILGQARLNNSFE